MLRSILCDYADAYILLKGTVRITGAGNDDAQKDQMKEIKAQYLKIVHHLLNAQAEQTIQTIVRPMYNLIEYGNNY